MKKCIALWACAAALAVLVAGCDKEKKPVEEAVTVPSDAVNLNAAGETANSYIVAPGKTSVFSAQFRGNSKTETVGAAASAELLWQDAASLIKDVYYVPETGQVVVSAGKASGNALVAVRDAKDNILWSWHLWVSDYDPAASLWSSPAATGGTVWKFMDRNLGASSADADDWNSKGLIYQWGRKDPFKGAVSFTVQNEDYSYSVTGEPVLYDIDNRAVKATAFEDAEGFGTYEKSIQNPTVFYKILKDGDGVNIPKSKDWRDSSDDDAWGGVSLSKSVNDPCPPGYKVPVCAANGDHPYEWHDYSQATWDEANYGMAQDGQWWPACGTRVNYSGGLDFPQVNPYSGMWLGTAGKASADLEANPALYGRYTFVSKGKRLYNKYDQKDSRSQGLSVRCVAE